MKNGFWEIIFHRVVFILIVLWLSSCGYFSNYGGSANDHNSDDRGVKTAFFAEEDCCTSHLECQDGIWCNGIERCNCWGVCLSGEPVNCDDGNVETVDICVNDYIGRPGIRGTAGEPGVDGEIGEGHCEHQYVGRPCVTVDDCDDDNACTDEDCVGGWCVYSNVTCDDGDVCTSDSCDPVMGCVYNALQNCCTRDSDCDDSYECTIDTCDLATNSCSYSANTGAQCSYDDECFNPGVCGDDGLCHPGPQQVPLNDQCRGYADIVLSEIGEACASGSTTCALHDYNGSCGVGFNADVVYRFRWSVDNSYQLYSYNVILDGDFNTVLYAETTCGDVTTEIACNDNCVNSAILDCDVYALSLFDSALTIPPYPVGSSNTVFFIVDGRGGERGDFTLAIHKVKHDSNPCITSLDNVRRVDATSGGEFRGNIDGYINDMLDESNNYITSPCHGDESAGSDWPARAWFVLSPSTDTTYRIWTDEAAPASWFDTVIELWDNSTVRGCNGTKDYVNCVHWTGRNGASNPTRITVTIPGGKMYMVGVSSYERPSSGNYVIHFDII